MLVRPSDRRAVALVTYKRPLRPGLQLPVDRIGRYHQTIQGHSRSGFAQAPDVPCLRDEHTDILPEAWAQCILALILSATAAKINSNQSGRCYEYQMDLFCRSTALVSEPNGLVFSGLECSRCRHKAFRMNGFERQNYRTGEALRDRQAPRPLVAYYIRLTSA
jgi:hypothetical protein